MFFPNINPVFIRAFAFRKRLIAYIEGKEEPEMYCKNDFVKSSKKRSAIRLIALMIGVIFVAGSLLSAAFIFTHTHHEHDHKGPDGGCATCAQLMAADNLLKSLTTIIIGAALGFGCFAASLSIPKPADYRLGFITLVCLKVRLNN